MVFQSIGERFASNNSVRWRKHHIRTFLYEGAVGIFRPHGTLADLTFFWYYQVMQNKHYRTPNLACFLFIMR